MLRVVAMAVKKQFTSFEDMIAGSDLPVLVDFYATWCGPCQIMAKILDEVGAQLKNQIQVVKIDTERYQELASKHHISALPTLLFFKNGQPIDRIEGVLRTEQLVQRLKGLL